MAELSPYKLFPELLREQNTSHVACLLYRANLVTNHIDITVPAKLFIYLYSCTVVGVIVIIYHNRLLTYHIIRLKEEPINKTFDLEG